MKTNNKILLVNSLLGMFFKFLSIVLGLLLVPIYMNVLGKEGYGLWITVLSVLSWINYFDIGLANGLRNNLTKLMCKNKYKECKEYIITTYLLVTIISISVLILGMFGLSFIDLNKFFNVNFLDKNAIRSMFLISMIFMSLNFISGIYKQLLLAWHKAWLVNLSQLVHQSILLLFILFIKNCTLNKLVLISLIYGLSLLLVQSFFTIYFFSKNKFIKPNLNDVNLQLKNSLLDLGIKFFIIQLAGLIMHSTDNILITKLLGPDKVTNYSIAFKYFNVLIVGFTVFLAPLWSLFTKAYNEKNRDWIISIMKKLHILLIGSSGCIIGLIYFSDYIIKLWVGNSVNISKSLLIIMGIYTFIKLCTSVYVSFIFGIGTLNIQVIINIIIAIINIPLSILLIKYFNEMGAALGTSICLLLQLILLIPESWYRINKIKKYKDGE